MLEYIIRELKNEEYLLLEDFLYEAIFQRDETKRLPKDVINHPTLKVYIEDFGSKSHDYCLCAQVGEKIAGAVWVRVINGFGNVDSETPEFAISLYKEYRGQGIGTAMMESMLEFLADKGYARTSLAVQKDNYALRMYEQVGFKVIGESEEEFIMEYRFDNSK